MPCRVAFERGKERHVHLVAVMAETSGSLLLIEDVAIKQRRGVIRVTAPLVGSDVSSLGPDSEVSIVLFETYLLLIHPSCEITEILGMWQPRVDEKHATWLHLRIRSPHQPMADVGKLRLPKTSPKVKNLVDGRWTLAFDDAEACKHACLFIQDKLASQCRAIRHIVSPFLATDDDDADAGTQQQ